MGAGASRQHHNHQWKWKAMPAPTPRGDSLPSLKDSIQSQMSVQDQRSSPEIENEETEEEVNVACVNTGLKASPNDTLETCTVKHPDKAENLITMLNRLQALKNFVDKNLNDPDDYATVGKLTLEGLFETSILTAKSAGTREAKQFTTLTECIIDVGGAEKLKLFVQHCFKKYSYALTEETDDEEKPAFGYTCHHCLWFALGIILNFSYCHQGFCSACAGAGIISMCFEIIKQIDAANSNWEEEDKDSRQLIAIIENSIAILNNISRRLRDRELFANREETLLYFAKKKVRTIAAPSLLTLAYLVDENTNRLILAEETLLSFIITLLDEAWQSKDRCSSGYSVMELAEGLSRLAINDLNKNILGQNGVIPVLISVIKTSKEDEEKGSATRALWMLAFDDNNKEAICQEEGAMDILHQLQYSENPQVQRAAAGALWELEGKTARHSERIESTGNHVMISYQWDSQEVLVELKNKLRASGYRVWMDLEQMGGSTLDAMAKAVENSSVVLVCVSERYKESPNCRAEAKYAFHLRKDIIPLMMQRNYMPDGWLGLIVGEKLRHDFHSKHVLKQSVTELIRELGGRGKEVDVTYGPSEPAVRAVQADLLAAPSSPGVSTWTNEEVKQWFKEIGLEKVCKKYISEMNGQSLTGLQQLREECAEYFYRCLERDLNLKNILDVLKFTKELRKLCCGMQ